MKNWTERAINFVIGLALLLGFCFIYLSVPILLLLINTKLKSSSIFPFAITVFWSMFVLKSVHYCYKRYFYDSGIQENLDPQKASNLTTSNTETSLQENTPSNPEKQETLISKNFTQEIIRFSLINIVGRLIVLAIILHVINHVVLPILVIDLELLSECQRNVATYGLAIGLLFITFACAITFQKNKKSVGS